MIDLLRAAGLDVLTDPAELDSYAYDASFASFLKPSPPDAVVRAHRTEDVQATLRIANEHGIPVTPRGAATGMTGGSVPVHGGIVLDMGRMNRILELDRPNLQVFTEPGVVHADLAAYLAKERLFFPPDPGSSRMCSVGGMVANNARGMRAVKYGATSEYILGLEVVLADGTVIWTGSEGSRAQQSASGLELSKYFAGSEGLLGVITQLRLKLRPLPSNRGLVLACFDNLDDPATCIGAVFDAGILPSAIEIMDEKMIYAGNIMRPELGLPSAVAILIFEVDGNLPSVQFDAKAIADIAGKWASRVEWADEPARMAQIWEARSVVGAAVGVLSPGSTRAYVGEDVSVPTTRLGEALQRIQAISAEFDIPIATYGHVGGGIVHTALAADLTNPADLAKLDLTADAIYRMALALGGSVTGEHGVGFVRAPYLPAEHGAALETMRTIKRALDPKGILNPGKFL